MDIRSYVVRETEPHTLPFAILREGTQRCVLKVQILRKRTALEAWICINEPLTIWAATYEWSVEYFNAVGIRGYRGKLKKYVDSANRQGEPG